MLTLKLLAKLLNILNKDATPAQIAGGMALGFVAGLTPTANLHNLVILILVLMIRVNISSAILAWGFFSAIAYLLDPVSNKIGYALLTAPALSGLWTALYNTPVVPWTNFNNTLVLGSLVLALLLCVPVYFLIKRGVINYRERIMARIQKWKIMQILKASKFYNLYRMYS
jgi:uncharacterized protein (TIGR03546 family)